MKKKNRFILIIAMLFLLLDITFAQDIWFVRPIDNTTYSGNGTETTSSMQIWWNAQLTPYPTGLGHYYKLITDDGTYSTSGGGTIPGWLNRAPGIYTWKIELYELYLGHSTFQLTATDEVTFFVKHRINIKNNFDEYASDIKIDNLTQTSNTTVEKCFGDNLSLEAINGQEYEGDIYVWRTNGTDLSDWKRKTKDGASYLNLSYLKSYNYTVQSDDNDARILGNQKVHTLPTTPSISLSGSWGSNPVLNFSGGSADVDHYVLKKEYSVNGGSFGRVLYVNPASSPYTDPEIERARFGGDAVARYSVKVVDIYDYESGYSSTVSTSGNSMWKSNDDEEMEITETIKEYSLNSNYPNPFNPTTQISYQIPENGFVNLIVYNSLGQEVAELVNQHQSVGQYSVKFNASNLPSGVYIYKLQAGEFSSTKKMMLTK